MHVLTVPNQKATANYVPAAAVIRRWQALSGIIGRKARVGGFKSDVKARLGNRGGSLETVKLECRRGKWNSMCSGEMRRYGGTPVAKATFWSVTTLMCESVGIKQD